MDKAQVTFAISAPIEEEPVPTPVLTLLLGSGGGVQTLTVLRGLGQHQFVCKQLRAPYGPLKGATADAWCALVGEEVYFLLLNLIGVQQDLPIIDGAL